MTTRLHAGEVTTACRPRRTRDFTATPARSRALAPRRRDLVGLAALTAAILIALQLGVTHWFYLYIPWFFPLVMIALLGRWGAPVRLAARG